MLDINILKEDANFVAQCKQKEAELELNGDFNVDENEVSADSYEPVTNDFPFIRKGIKYNFKHWFYLQGVKYYTKKANQLTNLKVVGKENMKGLKACIITCNHISTMDSFAVRKICMDYMFVAAEFNNFKGELGAISRHTGYLPIKSTLDKTFMKKFDQAITYYLHKNKKILIYPEQAMWRDYKKPRPLKNGAFHYAVKNNVPILPTFITIVDKKEKVDNQNRANFGDYTIHVLPPIYPQKDLSNKENVDYMRTTNYNMWKTLYEQTYGIPLEYTTIDKDKIHI